MTDLIDNAANEVQRRVAQDLDWFTPPGSKHFDPASVVFGFASLLITAFVAGFVDEASGTAKEAGRSTFRRLLELTKRFFLDEKEPEYNDLKVLAQKAPEVASTTDAASMRLLFEQTENSFRAELSATLPPDRATALAAEIRRAVQIHMLGAEP